MVGIRKVGINTQIFGHGGAADVIAPTVTSIEVGAIDDNVIQIFVSEALDTSDDPATSDFSVSGTTGSISHVSVGLGTSILVTLDEDIYDFEVVKISYTAGSNPIQDEAGNALANLTNEAVTNNGNASCTLDGKTLDYSNLGLTEAQVNAHIAGLSTCTNSTIDISGTNAHRTAASNADLNTLYENGNTITLNDTLGAELHTTANAASDPEGNEADGTDGWSESGLNGTGNNKFESQGSVKSVGNFALHANCNDTASANANFNLDIQAAPFSITNGDVVRLEFKTRHVGSGGAWRIGLGAVFVDNIIEEVAPGETTWFTRIYYWTHDATHRYFIGIENNGSQNGGVYFDNFSVRKVTFP